jgi:hypothetical protein
MSAITTFDEKRDEAKEYIRKTVDCLSICVSPNTYGYSEMNPHYIDKLIEVLTELIKAERKL